MDFSQILTGFLVMLLPCYFIYLIYASNRPTIVYIGDIAITAMREDELKELMINGDTPKEMREAISEELDKRGVTLEDDTVDY